MKKLASYLTVILCSLSCNVAGDDAAAQLESAERLMETAPDSSLTILKSIDRNAMKPRKLSARFALLYSMALDKNCIDIASDSIIAPAVAYYKNHGNADDRLKTCYYWGRTAMNAGEYEDAISRFILAEQYVEDTLNARLRLDELKSYWNILTPRQISNWYSATLLWNEFTRRLDAKEVISEYLAAISNPSAIRWLSVANAYYYSGELKKASEALEKAEQYENQYFLFYHLISGHINADMGNYRRAAYSYRQLYGIRLSDYREIRLFQERGIF